MAESAPPPGRLADESLVVAEDVTFAGADGDAVGGYLAAPAAGSGPRPAMIVVHEAFGLNDHIRDVARRFAGAGYTTLAPDLYTREGAPDAADIGDVLAKMFGVPDERAVRDLEGAAALLRGRDDATGAVGVIGFCSGGRQTLLFASRSDVPTAAVDCWGGFITRATFEEAATAERREDDDNPAPADVEAAAERARAAGRDVTMRRYPDAGHAFFADYRDSYAPAAAAALWEDVGHFLAAHLDKETA
jgi:carboxymethylenebutenolidase